MKNRFVKSAVALFFIVIFISPVYSQGNYYDFQSANISFLIPSGWVTSEHLLLLMMPKNEDLHLKFELINDVSKDEAVINTVNELKTLYPNDTNFIFQDYVINKFKIKEINQKDVLQKINYFIIETPENKIIRIYYIAPKEIALKYNSDIQKIIKSLKLKG